MNKDERISDEQLGAFMDGELDTEEESRIFVAAETCPELDTRLCQQRKLRELLQHAYRDPPRPVRPGGKGRRHRKLFGLAAAAVLLLLAGLSAGWFAGRVLDGGVSSGGQLVAANPDSWLLHVASDDPARMEMALDRAEELASGSDGVVRHVEIVANESGLNMLRSDVTPYAGRIRRLAEDDVLFFACSRAIERLEERGIKVRLVPEADTNFSALDRVVYRMQQGWTYEKI